MWYAVISEDHEDPYITAGVYRKVTVKPFNPVLP